MKTIIYIDTDVIVLGTKPNDMVIYENHRLQCFDDKKHVVIYDNNNNHVFIKYEDIVHLQVFTSTDGSVTMMFTDKIHILSNKMAS